MERNVLATLAGPHLDPFDCHVTSALNVAATGSFQALSINSAVRVTDDWIASCETLDWPAIKSAAPPSTPTTAITITPKARLRFIAESRSRQQQENEEKAQQRQSAPHQASRDLVRQQLKPAACQAGCHRSSP
jgi:hypothetical protein